MRQETKTLTKQPPAGPDRDRINSEPAPAPEAGEALVSIAKALHRELNPHGPPRRADLDASLESDWGFDSLTRAELFLRIEQASGVSLPERLLTEAQSLSELKNALGSAPLKAPPAEAPAPASAIGVGEAAPAGLATLTDVLDWHAAHHGEQCHAILLGGAGEEIRISYGDLAAGARRIAAGLMEAGVLPGDRIAIMLPTGSDFFAAYFGSLYAGAIPAPIYPPAHAEQLAEHLLRQAGILRNADARLLIVDQLTHGAGRLLRLQLGSRIRMNEAGALAREPGQPLPRIEPGQGALLQYTSGSTGDPKGVLLNHANLLANIRAMGDVVAPTPEDVFVSWLPLYHDMGLIGAWLGSLVLGVPIVLFSPLQFLARPERWLWAIHHYRGTLTAAPNFAYERCASAIHSDRLKGLDLGSLRMAASGAEPVSPETVRRFTARMRPYGFSPAAMCPAYGLAENGAGLSLPRPGSLPLIDRIDRKRLEAEGRAVPAGDDVAHAIEFVSCGEPIPGHEMRIMGRAGELGEREEGELEFRGPSATSGYFNNPEKTHELFDGTWLRSGDLAYVAGGQLFVTGRSKDIVIRAGQHIYPQEVEEAVGSLKGILQGGVAAFGSMDPRSGTERLVVVAETREQDAVRLDKLRRAVAGAIGDLLGTPPEAIMLVPPGAVPKTASGKIRRSFARHLYESESLAAPSASVRRQLLALALEGIRVQARGLARSTPAILYALYWWIAAGLVGLLSWPLVLLLPVRSWRWAAVGGLGRLFLALTGVRLRAVAEASIPEGAIIVANHGSYLDGLALAAVLPHPLRFVAKREFAPQLIAGPFLRALGTIFVERDVAGGIESERALMDLAKSGEPIVIFPEGTFAHSPGLRPFHLGAFTLAAAQSIPVVPVAIRGTRSLLCSLSELPRRGPIEVRVATPLVSSGQKFADAVRLRDAARSFIAAHCGEAEVSAT